MIQAVLLGTVVVVLSAILFLNESHAQEENFEEIREDIEYLKTELEKSKSDVTFEVIVAIIAIVTAGGTGIFNYLFSRKQKQHDAHTDYVYEARKNLYKKCEPILFLYSELSENALYRIKEIAIQGTKGKLEGLLSSNDIYFMRSTLYRLLIPHAAFRILQRQVTQFDLEIDQRIKNKYLLAKILYYTFSQDRELAKSDPEEPYYRNDTTKEKNLNADQLEAANKHQGIYANQFDIITESLIKPEENGNWRLLSYGEFNEKYSNDMFRSRFIGAYDLFENFHPSTRPILWRMLIAQAHLYKAMQKIRLKSVETLDFESFKQISKIENLFFEWRQSEQNILDEDFKKPFVPVDKYLESVLTEK